MFTIGLEDEILLSENYSNNNNENYEKMLNVKIYSGKHGIVSFFPEKSPITIGRSSDCEILIDDNIYREFIVLLSLKMIKGILSME